MIYAANHYRLGQTAIYDSNVPVSRKPEFVPWTSSTGPRGVRSVIRKQVRINLSSLVSSSGSPNLGKSTFRLFGYELKYTCVVKYGNVYGASQIWTRYYLMVSAKLNRCLSNSGTRLVKFRRSLLIDSFV